MKKLLMTLILCLTLSSSVCAETSGEELVIVARNYDENRRYMTAYLFDQDGWRTAAAEVSPDSMNWMYYFFDHNEICARITASDYSYNSAPSKAVLPVDEGDYVFNLNKLCSYEIPVPDIPEYITRVTMSSASINFVRERDDFLDEDGICLFRIEYDRWGGICGLAYGDQLQFRVEPEETEETDEDGNTVITSVLNYVFSYDETEEAAEVQCTTVKTYDKDDRLIAYRYDNPSEEEYIDCRYSYGGDGAISALRRETEYRTLEAEYDASGRLFSLQSDEYFYLYHFDDGGELREIVLVQQKDQYDEIEQASASGGALLDAILRSPEEYQDLGLVIAHTDPDEPGCTINSYGVSFMSERAEFRPLTASLTGEDPVAQVWSFADSETKGKKTREVVRNVDDFYVVSSTEVTENAFGEAGQVVSSQVTDTQGCEAQESSDGAFRTYALGDSVTYAYKAEVPAQELYYDNYPVGNDVTMMGFLKDFAGRIKESRGESPDV